MNVGRIGQPRRITGAPSADIAGAAMALLVTFGRGDETLHTLLAELRQADEHNAGLAAALDERLRELANLEDRAVAVAAAEARIDEKLAALRVFREELTTITRDLADA